LGMSPGVPLPTAPPQTPGSSRQGGWEPPSS